MAAEPISNLNGGVEPASSDVTDLLATVDVSDTTQAPTGTTKPLSISKLVTLFNTALSFLSSVNLDYTASTRTVTNDGGTDAVLPIFTATEAGLVPLSGGSATDFLSADGTFKAAGGARVQVTADSSVSFTAEEVYNTATTPLTGNLTVDQTGAVLGIVQKLYHNDTVAPTITGVSDVQLMGDGVYFTNELNVIYFEWTETNRVEYWVVQEQ